MNRPVNKDLKIAKKIGNKVKTLRSKLGLTQFELAERAGITDYKVVGFVEQAATYPSLKTLVKLARALNVPVAELVDGI